MPDKKNTGTASDTVKTQLAQLSLDNAALTTKANRLEKANTLLKQNNLDLTRVIETKLKSDIIMKIQVASKHRYTPDELQSRTVEELLNIEEVLEKGGALSKSGSFKSIRAGTAGFDHSARLTVGSLYKPPESE